MSYMLIILKDHIYARYRYKSDNRVEAKQRYLKIKGITFLIILLLGMLFSNSINVANAAKIQTPNVDGGESLWFNIDVNTLGIIGIDAYTNSTNTNPRDAWMGWLDTISIYLFDPENKLVATASGNNQCSINYNANTTGTYKLRVFLQYVYVGEANGKYQGSTRTIGTSSNYPLGLIQSPTFTPTSSSIPSTTPTPTTTAILVTSFPSGANVYIEGIYKGITPIKLPDLPQGSPTVKLMLEGYKDWQQNIDIASGKISYIPVALEPSTIQSSRLTPEDEIKLLDKFKKEISNFSKQDRENLVNIHFQDANKNLANGNYEAAKTYSLLAKAISEDLKDQNLIEKAEMLLEIVNTKIEGKNSTKLVYELLLALGAALIFGYIFGDTFEKKMKKKVHKYLIIAFAFLILFLIFYTLGRFL
jgi:hypothetical protein